MRTFCNWVRTGKPLNHSQPYATPIDPLPDVIAKRPHLAPSVGTGCATDEHRDAQQEWLAHIAAGRSRIGQEFAQKRRSSVRTLGTFAAPRRLPCNFPRTVGVSPVSTFAISTPSTPSARVNQAERRETGAFSRDAGDSAY